MKKPISMMQEYSAKRMVSLFCAMVALPIYLIRYRGFWGLRGAALHGGWLARRVYGLYVNRHGAAIPLSVEMPYPPCFPHGINGIYISDEAKIGRDVVIFQQVTIGEDTFKRGTGERSSPEIGNGVYVGAGAKIIGGVAVGDNCRIGANCCVYKDLPANSTAVCASTRVIPHESLNNRFSDRGGTGWYFHDGEWVC